MYAFIVVLFGIVAAWAQPPEVEWANAYFPGTAFVVEPMPDGRFVAAGSSYGDNYEFALAMICVTSAGEISWSHFDSTHGYFLPSDMAICADGDFLLVGQRLDSTLEDSYVIRTDSVGNTEWSYCPVLEGDDGAESVLQSDDGATVVAGWRESYAYVAMLNDSGALLSWRDYDLGGYVYPAAMEKTPSGQYVIVGSVWLDGRTDSDLTIFKVDSEGDTLWSRVYGSQNRWEQGIDLVFLPNEDMYVLGDSARIWLMKTNSEGLPYWSHTYADTAEWGWQTSNVSGCVATYDGGCVIASTSMWSIGHPPPVHRFMVRTDSLGGELWCLVFDEMDFSSTMDICASADSGYVVAGDGRGPGGFDWGFNLCKLASDILPADEPSEIVLRGYGLEQNYPNPFNAQTTISFDLERESEVRLTVCDITGRGVLTLVDGVMAAGEHAINLDASALPSGIYVYRLQTNGYSQSRKLVLLK